MDPLDIPLRDIHLPEPVSWWPIAPGWWLVGALLLAFLIVAWLAWQRYRRRRVQRAALREFAAIEARFREHGDTHRLAAELSNLARRVAVALSPQQQTHAVTGDGWIEILASLSVSGHDLTSLTEAITVAPYRRAGTIDGNTLLDTFRPWLEDLRPLGPELS